MGVLEKEQTTVRARARARAKTRARADGGVTITAGRVAMVHHGILVGIPMDMVQGLIRAQGAWVCGKVQTRVMERAMTVVEWAMMVAARVMMVVERVMMLVERDTMLARWVLTVVERVMARERGDRDSCLALFGPGEKKQAQELSQMFSVSVVQMSTSLDGMLAL